MSASPKILLTGAAGFIGMHAARALCNRGYEVIGVDNLNDYYDVNLKEARLDQLKLLKNFSFERGELSDAGFVRAFFKKNSFTKVLHLAAQAGVRYSLEKPEAYISSNIVAFQNILDACRHVGIEHLVYASSSSVYGANEKTPFSESDRVDQPVSLYAATKRANELVARVYSHLFKLPTTGLRFFTVYGPWGRPDMSPMLFADAISNGRKIPIFNHGQMRRDFTYVDDIVNGVVRVLEKTPTGELPAKIFNIGNNQPIELLEFVRTLEKAMGRTAQLEMKPMQAGDVLETHANIDELARWVDFRPETSLKSGLAEFVKWYQAYYSLTS